MDFTHLCLVSLAVGLVAFLYSSVGHAGASGYIAVMTLAGFASALIKPTALVLNIIVACIGSFQFWRAGHFSWQLFWPFAALAVPAAFLGGYVQLPASIFKPLVGVVLLFSAVRLFFRRGDPPEVKPPALPTALGIGASIGFLSGLTGTGGGIFLTPLLLFCRWARTRSAAATSALFILVNSAAGLTGHVSSGQRIPSFAWLLAAAAVVGGGVGSHLGSRRFPVRTISLMLAAVLVIAGAKLIFTR
ncbi:MAG: sulfite exporter TauE/SafE family protein [Verrucomicrobia bacterium]|nr:sulfite exporter TauE/SafE family protein [Verrucomicrobiota bacterium]